MKENQDAVATRLTAIKAVPSESAWPKWGQIHEDPNR